MKVRALALAALLCAPARAQDPKLQQAVQATVDKKVTTSASVAIVQHGKIVFSFTTGKDATPRTRYHIGSTTKMFTALAIMQLVERKKLSLDDKLARFFPKFPGASKITIRQLLNHRSGIPNYLDQALAQGRCAKPTTPTAILEEVAKLPALPLGSFSYSNSNYVLLGQIIEQLSGASLQDYYEKNFFQVAGFQDADGPVAQGFTAGKPVEPGHLSWYYACGDQLASAQDLARFDIALMDGRIVKPATLATMHQGALPTGHGRDLYGLGLQIFPLGDFSLAGHHGGVPGFEADDEMFFSERFGVVALGNDSNFPTSSIMGPALVSFYPQEMAKAKVKIQAYKAQQAKKMEPLTVRFTAFMKKLTAGDARPLDPQMDEALNKALSPLAVTGMRLQLVHLGAFQKLTFSEKDEMQGFQRYHYQAVFSRGNKPITFVLDQKGRLSGTLNQ